VSWTKLRAGLVLSAVAVLFLGAACKRNHPPTIPEVSGRLTYRPGDTARLSATSTDQDDDSLSYLFAWVDSASAVWSSNYANGVPATATHLYASPDSHVIRVRARDTRGAESDWSAAETIRVGTFVPGTPALPVGPSSCVTGDTFRCSTCATSPYAEPVRIEYDWGGAKCDSWPPVLSDSPCVGTHVYYYPGTFHIKARASDTTGLASPWSDSLTVAIACYDSAPPAVSIVSPADGGQVRRGLVEFKAVATDNQIVARVEFAIDGTPVGADSVADHDTFSYAWTDTAAQVIGRSYTIVATAFDAGDNQASDTISISISDFMKWYWQGPHEGAMMTSAVVANDGEEEVVMSYCWDDFKFYTIKARSGQSKSSATTVWPEYDFNGHPALCATTGHVIVGSQEGELYALTLPSLACAWRWPDIAPEDSEPFNAFGAPAISGNVIYVGRDQDRDTLYRLYKFTDLGTSVTPGPTYALTNQEVVDAPVVDVDGSVYFGTDSGYLIKLDANLVPHWRLRLVTPIGEVNGPIIGGDGTIYCGSDSFRLYAVSPNGNVKWAATLDGVGARPALGRSALFVGTDMGTVYSIDPTTGAVNWQKPFGQSRSFTTAPIVAANGYVYFQNDDDVLYCLNQADGTFIWTCDCNSYLPGDGRSGNLRRPRKLQLTDYDPNPSITSDGDIIVVGYNALFCVSGYKDGPLDGAAAWPKWQKDLSNTGKK
jgi:outer membrane protein assembly factor BamB